jgi:chromosome segregation ATPase
VSNAPTVTVNGTVRLTKQSVRAAGSVLGALRAERIECQLRLSSLGRQVGSLELQLERIDREQARTYRRIAQLEEAIIGERSNGSPVPKSPGTSPN